MTKGKKFEKNHQLETNYSMLKSLGLSVVLAGGVVLGGAGAAGAAGLFDTVYADGIGDTVTITTPTGNSWASNDGFVGTLTIQNGGKLEISSTGRVYTQSLTVAAGGTLKVSSGYNLIDYGLTGSSATDYKGTANLAGTIDLTGGGTIAMGQINVTGGTVDMSSSTATIWDQNASLTAVGDTNKSGQVAISGASTVINMGNKSAITGGYDPSSVQQSVLLEGGTLNIKGGTGDNASLIRASSSPTEALAGAKNFSSIAIKGGTINVGDVNAAGHGVIASRQTDMSGGTINIANNGSLTVVGTLKKGVLLGVGISDAANTQWGEFNMSGGAINVTKGILEFYQHATPANGSMAFNQSGGELNVTGDTTNRVKVKEYNLSGGTLNMGTAGTGIHILEGGLDSGNPTGTVTISENATVNLAKGSLIQVKDLNITGGVLNVGGVASNHVDTKWREGSSLEAYNKLNMTGGIVNLTDYGQMVVHFGDSVDHFLILNGGTVNMKGTDANTASLIRASDTKLTESSNANAAKLQLSGATVNVEAGKFGVIAAKTVDMSAGSLNVASGGVLEVKAQLADAADNSSVAMTSTYTSAANAGMTINDTVFNMTGGTLKVADKLTVNSGATLAVGGNGILSAGSIDNKGTASVGGKGVVNTKLESFASDFTVASVSKALTVNAGGTLNLTNTKVATAMSAADIRAYLKALAGDGATYGTVNIIGEQLKLTADSKIDSLEDAVGLGNVTADRTVSSNKGTIDAPDGNTQVKNIQVTADTDATLKAERNNSINLVGGASGTDLIVTQAGKTASVTANGGTVTLGSVATNPTLEGAGARTNGNLSGNAIATGATGALEFTNINTVVGAGANAATTATTGAISATDRGTVTLANAAVDATKLDLANSSAAVTMGSTLRVGSLITDQTSKITVGDVNGKGSLEAANVNMNGASLFLDPAWKGSAELDKVENASSGALVFKEAKVDGLLTVGRNSILSVGSTSVNWAINAINSTKGKIGWGENTTSAALAVFSPQTLNGGGITVNGALDTLGSVDLTDHAVAGSLYLGEKSLLVVNAQGLGEKFALTGTIATISANGASDTNGAKLLLVDAQAGKDVNVLNFTGATTGSFSAGNVFFNNALLKFDAAAGFDAATAGKLTVTPEFNVAAFEELQGAGLGQGGGNIARVYMERGNDIATNQFMENALNTSLHGDNFHSMAMSLEAGLDTARAVDTMGAGMMTVSATSSLTLDRAAGNNSGNSVGLSGGAASGLTFGLWGMPTYAHTSLDNADIDGTTFSVDSKTNTYGGIIGADLTFGADQNYRVGAAFNVGAGDSEATHDGIKTKNDFDYVGGAIYAAGMYDKFRLAGIVGYTSMDNDIKQDQLGGQLKSKPDADLWNFGVEASYTFTFGDGIKVVPSLGLEWLHYSQDSYNTTLNNVAVVNVASASANRVNLPIGVKLNKTFALSESSSITPEVRAAVIPSFGSDMDTNASLPGIIGANGNMKGINTDSVAGEVGVGLSVNLNQNFSLAAGYDLQFSKNRTNHNVNAMLRVKF